MKHQLLNTYKRADITFLSGQGARLYDSTGKEYLDFLAGLAVVSVGHAHPGVTRAIQEQAARLLHVSNLFWTEPGIELSRKLSEVSGGSFKSFFCNSGAEAVECALKFARKATAPERTQIICADGSFHGRTYAALAATGQPAKWEGFAPLPMGFQHAAFNDLDAFEKLIDNTTAAVLVEPVQGEGGVFPAEPEFLMGLSKLCQERGALLLFDEVQCGCGRTGSFWAWQQYGVRPDVFVTAKGLGNGLPIGVCLIADEIASHFAPGDHGSTFGGGPLQASAALAVVKALEEEGLIASVQSKGQLLCEQLERIDGVEMVRGLGLMRAAKLDFDGAAKVTERLLELGVIVNNVRPNALRITPPLCVTEEEIMIAVDRVKQAILECRS